MSAARATKHYHLAERLFASAFDNLRVAALDFVFAPVNDLFNIVIANPSNQKINIYPNVPIASVFLVYFSAMGLSTAATYLRIFQLTNSSKF